MVKSNFEKDLQKLEAIVDKLEGELPLSKALALYREGILLVKQCQEIMLREKREVQILENGLLREFDPVIEGKCD